MGVRMGRTPLKCQSGGLLESCMCAVCHQALASVPDGALLSTFRGCLHSPSFCWSGTCSLLTKPPPQARAVEGAWCQQARGRGTGGRAGCAANGPGSRLEPAAQLRPFEASLPIVSIQLHLQMAHFVREALGVCCRTQAVIRKGRGAGGPLTAAEYF